MDKKFLKELLETHSPSGYETEATEVFNNYCSQFSKHVSLDKMGNSVFKVGSGFTKIMISGHIDELGLQVQYITDKGMIHFITLGGIDKKTLPGSKVIIHGKDNKSIHGIIGKSQYIQNPMTKEVREVLKFQT